MTITHGPTSFRQGIHGTLGPIAVEVRRRRDPGRNRISDKDGTRADYHFLRYVVSYRSAGPELLMQAHSEATADRTDGVQVGAKRFDNHIFVGSSDVAGVQDYLTAERQDAFLAVVRRWGDTAQVSQQQIVVEDHRRDVNDTMVEEAITTLVALAHLMRIAPPPPAPPTIAPAAPATASPVIAPVVPKTKPRIAVQDDIHDAKRIAENAAAQQPRQRQERDVFSASDPVPGQLPPFVQANDFLRLRQQEMIDDLFDGRLAGAQVADLFARTCMNRRVEWSGTVAETDGKLQVVVLLGSSGMGALSNTDVFAVLRLTSRLFVEPGNPVTFVGTVISMDRQDRKIYVNDADLV